MRALSRAALALAASSALWLAGCAPCESCSASEMLTRLSASAGKGCGSDVVDPADETSLQAFFLHLFQPPQPGGKDADVLDPPLKFCNTKDRFCTEHVAASAGRLESGEHCGAWWEAIWIGCYPDDGDQ